MIITTKRGLLVVCGSLVKFGAESYLSILRVSHTDLKSTASKSLLRKLSSSTSSQAWLCCRDTIPAIHPSTSIRPLISRNQNNQSSLAARFFTIMSAGAEADTYEYTESDFIHQTAPWIDRTAPQLSKFDLEVRKRWDEAMEAGVFRYGIDHIVTRILPGDKRYVGQLNTLRATERRKPQEITSVNQPFNEKSFNFTRVKPAEVVFNLRNVTKVKKGTPSSDAVCNGSLTNGAVKNGEVTNGDLNSHSSLSSSICSEDVLSQEDKIESSAHGEKKEERHTLIVNVSPMEYGHCLLVPQIDSKQPQVLTKTALQVAIETMLLSQHRGFRMGFNSLCAFASVNHLHFHVYYLEHELIVDYAPVRHLAGRFFEFTAIPCPGFAIQLYGSTVEEMARLAHRISSYFHESDVAHNIYMSRGCVFGEERNSSLTTVRLFIWPRRKFIGKKSSEEFNVACIELGGHLPIKEVDGYHKLTEADVDAIIEDAQLPEEQYAQIREKVTQMGMEEAEKLKGKRD